MKDRIGLFIKTENKTAVQFAKEIGVQPSAVSHILSGRNNPSLDFILRMLNRYDYLSTDWLLFGKGDMYKVKINEPTLFDVTPYEVGDKLTDDDGYEDNYIEKGSDNLVDENSQIVDNHDDINNSSLTDSSNTDIEKIVWFYSDNTFSVFTKR